MGTVKKYVRFFLYLPIRCDKRLILDDGGDFKIGSETFTVLYNTEREATYVRSDSAALLPPVSEVVVPQFDLDFEIKGRYKGKKHRPWRPIFRSSRPASRRYLHFLLVKYIFSTLGI